MNKKSSLNHPLKLLLAWIAPQLASLRRDARSLLPRFNLVSAQLHPTTHAALHTPALYERVERELTPVWNVDAALAQAALAPAAAGARDEVLAALRSPLQLSLAALLWPRASDLRSSWERIRAAMAQVEQVFSVRWAYWFYVTKDAWPFVTPLIIVVFECNVEMLTAISADERPYLALVLRGDSDAGASYSVLRVADMTQVDPKKHWPLRDASATASCRLLSLGWLPPTLFQNMADPTYRYRPLDGNASLAPMITVDAEALDEVPRTTK